MGKPMTITMTKPEAEQTAAKMDELQRSNRKLVGVAKAYARGIDMDIQIAMANHDTEVLEILTETYLMVREIIKNAEGIS